MIITTIMTPHRFVFLWLIVSSITRLSLLCHRSGGRGGGGGGKGGSSSSSSSGGGGGGSGGEGISNVVLPPCDGSVEALAKAVEHMRQTGDALWEAQQALVAER